jgi:hypothetical protein
MDQTLTSYDNFQNLTGFDVYSLLSNFSDFVNNNMQDIVNYYSLAVTTPNMESFNKMTNLLNQFQDCLSLFFLYKQQLNTFDFWDLLEDVEDSNQTLLQIQNIGWYLRSSIPTGDFNIGTIKDLPIIANTTIEGALFNQLGDSDPDNNWVPLALQNEITEEQYGSKSIMLKYETINVANNYFLNTVLGPLQGEQLYGIDICRVLQMVQDSNGNWDFGILTPKQTAQQAVDIYLGLKRGDNPEFPNDGIQVNLVIGSNLGSLKFPVLFRQLTAIFAKDDTFTSFAITNAKFQQDALFITAQIQTKYGSIFNVNVNQNQLS